MSGYKTDLKNNILNESALFVVFAMIKKYIELEIEEEIEIKSKNISSSNWSCWLSRWRAIGLDKRSNNSKLLWIGIRFWFRNEMKCDKRLGMTLFWNSKESKLWTKTDWVGTAFTFSIELFGEIEMQMIKRIVETKSISFWVVSNRIELALVILEKDIEEKCGFPKKASIEGNC